VLDDLGVDDDLARCHAMQCVDETVGVLDAVLDLIADPMTGQLEQADRVGGFSVVGEHQQPDGRVAGADLLGRPQTLVPMSGRHPDVQDDDVGRVGRDAAQQLGQGIRLAHHEVRSPFQMLGPAPRRNVSEHWHGGTLGEHFDGSRKALLAQRRRKDPLAERAKLTDHLAELLRRRRYLFRRSDVAAGCLEADHRLPGAFHQHGHREQLVLHPVVQVSLDAPAFGVGGEQDACAGGSYLLELGALGRKQPRVVQRQAGCGEHGVDERPLVEQGRVVHQHGEEISAPHHGGRCAVVGGKPLHSPGRRIEPTLWRPDVGSRAPGWCHRERRRSPPARAGLGRLLQP
jgi:hypothetical protein